MPRRPRLTYPQCIDRVSEDSTEQFPTPPASPKGSRGRRVTSPAQPMLRAMSPLTAGSPLRVASPFSVASPQSSRSNALDVGFYLPLHLLLDSLSILPLCSRPSRSDSVFPSRLPRLASQAAPSVPALPSQPLDPCSLAGCPNKAEARTALCCSIGISLLRSQALWYHLRRRRWKRRWFELHGTMLKYHKEVPSDGATAGLFHHQKCPCTRFIVFSWLCQSGC